MRTSHGAPYHKRGAPPKQSKTKGELRLGCYTPAGRLPFGRRFALPVATW